MAKKSKTKKSKKKTEPMITEPVLVVQFVAKDHKGKIRNVEEYTLDSFLDYLEDTIITRLTKLLNKKRWGIFILASEEDLERIASDIAYYISESILYALVMNRSK